ncbi:unnamed protein product [Anisakis simplex]|uniref:WD_REPEATS_REGION domain-containing protein n=1 Tax=Anisakis simplex TaxID=6269 RepID=A0A0M3JUQ1_ANISI|nr:unnamed protein product [Anisakis simplex]
MKMHHFYEESDEMSLDEEQKISGWRCGVQSFDLTSNGRTAALVGVDSTLNYVSISYEDKTSSLHSFNNGTMQIWHLLFAPDREHFLTVNFSGSLTLLDMNGQVTKSGTFNAVRQISVIAYSADGASIAVANNEGVVTIVSASTLVSRFFFEAHALKIRAMRFSPDSTSLLTGSDDKTIKLHQIGATKSQLKRSFCAHRSSITALRYDHYIDGERFASCSNDSMIIVWNSSTGQQLHTFSASHDGVVNDIAFSFSNQYLVSVGSDRSLCIHRIDNKLRFESQTQSSQESILTDSQQPQMQDYDRLAASIYAESGMSQVNDEEMKEHYSAPQHNLSPTASPVDYNTYIPSTVQLTSSYHPTGLRRGVDEDEEDELLARARRDLEAVSNE